MRSSTVARSVARYTVSGTTPNGLRNSRYSSRMRRDQNEKSRTTSEPAWTRSARRARSTRSISPRTSSGRGIALMPRDQASWSKDRRIIPRCSYCRATVDFPDPAGPHMKMTRPMSATVGTPTRHSCGALASRQNEDQQVRDSAASSQRVQDALQVLFEFRGGVGAARKVVDERVLEQPVEHRVGHGRGHGEWRPREVGELGDDAPDHPLKNLVDFVHVSAECLVEHALVPQVVPEAVQRRLLAQRGSHGRTEPESEFGCGACGGHDAVVAGHAFGFVLPHAVSDQLELVAEVVMQDTVGELGILRDVA